MLNSLSEKTKTNLIVEIIEYIPEGESFKTVIKKQTGSVKTKQIHPEKDLFEQSCPYEIYTQVVEGTAELGLNGNKHSLDSGNGMMIPADSVYSIASDTRFKMILTIVKNNDN